MMHGYMEHIHFINCLSLRMLLFTPFVIKLLYTFTRQYTSFKNTDKNDIVDRNNFR